MVIVFEFTTTQGHKYPCNIKAKNKKEALKILKKIYQDFTIEYLCCKYIDEWECLTGLS